MCVKLKGSKMTPGQIHSFLTTLGKAGGVWGFQNGAQYNVRLESMPTVWKAISQNRGILTIDSFWEKDKQFVRSNGKMMHVGVLFNSQMEFAVITTPGKGIVQQYHHRMPLVLSDEHAEDFLEKDKLIVELNPGKFKIAV